MIRTSFASLLILVLCCSKPESTPARDSGNYPTTSNMSADTADASGRSDSAGISPQEVTQWRGATMTDKIDTLMADAFNAGGPLTASEEDYGFLRSDSALIEIGKQAGGIRRLVDCLGWDQRAAAQIDGQRILVGALCLQGILRSSYGQRLARGGPWPANIEERSPIEDYRRARMDFIKIMQEHPPE